MIRTIASGVSIYPNIPTTCNACPTTMIVFTLSRINHHSAYQPSAARTVPVKKCSMKSKRRLDIRSLYLFNIVTQNPTPSTAKMLNGISTFQHTYIN